MTTPISTAIVEALVTELHAMDVAGGYNLEWATNGGAQEVMNVNRLAQLPTCIVSDESEDTIGEFTPFQVQQLEIVIQALIDWPKSDDTFKIYRAIDLARADVYRCVLAANEATPVLGIKGLEKIHPTGSVKMAEQGGEGLAGALIRVTATYRHNSYDPGVYP